jgi:UDP-N-acetylmuramyl pentapeptide phosphotransferase/UDP-N-acetylglucosamine-1-phosphate transferase
LKINGIWKSMAHTGLTFLNVFAAFAGLIVIAVAAAFLTSRLIKHLQQRAILDRPNERSMHEVPTPVGGGIVVVGLTLVIAIAAHLAAGSFWAMLPLLGTLVLALVSWFDDQHQLSRGLRFAVQIVVVALSMSVLPADKAVIWDAWPLWFDRAVTGLFWVWFINLFNFMDGVDGLAGVEILSICAGIVIIGLYAGMPSLLLLTALVLAGATLGFLRWNWRPAKIFMGDVGSIAIGFFLGWLLIQLALDGHLVAALLLPGYFIADATITLVKRMMKGEAFWQPHRDHYYQRAAVGVGDHSTVVRSIMLANLFLIGWATASLYLPLMSLFYGIGIVVLLLLRLRRLEQGE